MAESLTGSACPNGAMVPKLMERRHTAPLVMLLEQESTCQPHERRLVREDGGDVFDDHGYSRDRSDPYQPGRVGK